jgi:hypothetical protein
LRASIDSFTFSSSLLALPQKSRKESNHPESNPGIVPALVCAQFVANPYLVLRRLVVHEFVLADDGELLEARTDVVELVGAGVGLDAGKARAAKVKLVVVEKADENSGWIWGKNGIKQNLEIEGLNGMNVFVPLPDPSNLDGPGIGMSLVGMILSKFVLSGLSPAELFFVALSLNETSLRGRHFPLVNLKSASLLGMKLFPTSSSAFSLSFFPASTSFRSTTSPGHRP